MTVYAYARVSTEKQSIERQIVNICKAYPEIGERNIYTEKMTGTRSDRPEFQRLLNKLQAGDTVVLDSVSRFSRNSEQGFELYQDLYGKGVNLIFLKEPYINTENYRMAMSVTLPESPDEALVPMFEGIQKTLMNLAKRQFKQAFDQAEKEVTDLRQRVKEGMKASGAAEKIRQAQTGQKYHVKKQDEAIEQIRKHSRAFGGSLKDEELRKLIGCSLNSFYKYKKLAAEKDS